MKIKKIIERVDQVRPNSFSEDIKIAWLTELDGQIAADVMLLGIEEIRQLETADGEAELLIGYPHTGVYENWLVAKIDYAYGEYDKYQNTMAMFNSAYSNLVRWFARVYSPATNCRNKATQFYLSAYGIACAHGFRGTVEEWLLSLRGEPFRFEDFTPEQIESLRGPRGLPGVYLGDGEMPEDCTVQIIPEGEADLDAISAYEIACASGFEGTVEEWLQSLVGEKGEKGEDGKSVTVDSVFSKISKNPVQNKVITEYAEKAYTGQSAKYDFTGKSGWRRVAKIGFGYTGIVQLTTARNRGGKTFVSKALLAYSGVSRYMDGMGDNPILYQIAFHRNGDPACANLSITKARIVYYRNKDTSGDAHKNVDAYLEVYYYGDDTTTFYINMFCQDAECVYREEQITSSLASDMTYHELTFAARASVFEKLKALGSMQSPVYAPLDADGASFGSGVVRIPTEEGWYRVLEMDRSSFLTFYFSTDMNGAMTRGVLTATGHSNRYGYIRNGVLGKPSLVQLAYEVTGSATAMNYTNIGIPKARIVYPKGESSEEVKCYLEIYRGGKTASGSLLSGNNLCFGYNGNGISLCRDEANTNNLPASTFNPETEAEEVLRFENHAIVADNFYLKRNGKNINLADKSYRLVNDITVEDDVDSLILTADDAGNPYDYQEVLIFWQVKKKADADSAMFRLNANPQIPTSDTIVCISNPPIKKYDFCVAARAYIRGGRLFSTFRAAENSFCNEAAYPVRPESLGANALNSISFLRFWGENSVAAGTTIQIYALEG